MCHKVTLQFGRLSGASTSANKQVRNASVRVGHFILQSTRGGLLN